MTINPFNARPIFVRKKIVFLGNFIATLVFMLEKNFDYYFLAK